MSFNTADGRAEYTATAAQEDFDFVFKIYETSDLKVWLTPVGDVADDELDVLTEDVDYTVSINGDDGGTLTLLSAATAGDYVTLVRDLPAVRETEYQFAGDLRPEVLNADQNYQTYLSADQKVAFDKVVKLPESSQNVSGDLPAAVSDAYLKWNADADALENDVTIPQAVIDSAESAAEAELRAWEAEADALTAVSYAVEAEDVLVNVVTSDDDGNFTYAPQTGVYSSLHWATKSAVFNPALYALLTGAIFTGQVKGITPVSAEDLVRKDYADTKSAIVIDVNFSGDVDTLLDAGNYQVNPAGSTNLPTAEAGQFWALNIYGDDSGCLTQQFTRATSNDTYIRVYNGSSFSAYLQVGTGGGASGALTTDDYFHAREEQTAGTDGGTNVVGRQVRTLNTVKKNTMASASLSSDKVSLSAGTYYARASAPSRETDSSRLICRNETDGADLLLGQSANVNATDSDTAMLDFKGVFTLTATKNISVTQYTQTLLASRGLGRSALASGDVEVYAEIEIWKVG